MSSHPISNLPKTAYNPITFISTDFSSGTSLFVDNTASFYVNDFILLEKYGIPEAEIVQISSVVSDIELTVSSPNFAHSSDCPVTKINYNKYRLYRSLTGVGGSYVLLGTYPLPVEQDKIYGFDASGVSPYSYQFSFYNSASSIESSLSAEIPYAGFPVWALTTIQKNLSSLFSDKRNQIVTNDDIRDWLNWYVMDLMTEIVGGESPYYVNSTIITTTGNEFYDISSLSALAIIKVEYSFDNGISFRGTVFPTGFSWDNYGNIESAPLYLYRVVGQQISIQDSGRNNLIAGQMVRIWYYTNPTPLSLPSDMLPDPLKPYVGHFMDYLMMRSNQKRGDIADNASFFTKELANGRGRIISTIKQRIRQPGMQEPSLYGAMGEAF